MSRAGIDRGFLQVLNSMPATASPGLSDEERERFDSIAYKHSDALVYLVRQDDADANRAMLRCVMHDLAFGGCCCTRGEMRDAVYRDGPTPSFWRELERLGSVEQSRVIVAVHASVTEDDGEWIEGLERFAVRHAGVAAVVQEIRSREVTDAEGGDR